MNKVNLTSMIFTLAVVVVIAWIYFSTFTSPAHLCANEYGQNWTAENPDADDLSEFTCVNTKTGNTTQFEWPTNVRGVSHTFVSITPR